MSDGREKSIETACLADLPDNPEGEAARECGYRRGFAHGVQTAINALNAGHDVEALREYIDQVMEWRYAREGGEMTQPPEIGP